MKHLQFLQRRKEISLRCLSPLYTVLPGLAEAPVPLGSINSLLSHDIVSGPNAA